jgi:AmpD protein
VAAPGALIEQGWIRGARRIASPNQDARPAGMAIDLVIIHAISLPPGEFGGPYVAQLFTNCLDPGAHPYFAEIAHLRVSAHFLIGRSGELTQFVAIDRRAWHAGESVWEGRPACNDYALGIELEGTDEAPFTDAQYAALALLLGALRARLPALTPDRIVGHADVAPGRKTDPGPHFDWSRLRRSLIA